MLQYLRQVGSTLAVALIAFTLMLDTSVVNVSLPIMANDFHLDALNTAWIITSFGSGLAVGLLVASSLASRLGEIRVFVGGSLLFAVVSVACGATDDIALFIVLRLAQGALSGIVVAISQYVIAQTMRSEKRAFALSVWGSAVSFAPTLGPLAGAMLTDTLGWPWLFYLNLPLILLALLLIDFKSLANSGKAPESINWAALIWVFGFVYTLQIIVDFGEYLEWFKSDYLFICGILTIVSLIFFLHSNHSKNPLFDFGLFKNQHFFVGTLTLVLGNSLILAALLVVPIWLQNVYGMPIFETGMIVAASSLISAMAAPFIGRYMKAEYYLWSALASVALLSLSFWLMSGYTLSSDSGHLYFPRWILGAGLALFYVPLVAYSMQSLEPAQMVAGNAISLFLRVICANLAIGAALSIIINLQASEQAARVATSDYHFNRDFYTDAYPYLDLVYRITSTQAFQKIFFAFSLLFALIFFILLVIKLLPYVNSAKLTSVFRKKPQGVLQRA